MRFINWIMPPLVVPVAQLRPSTEYVERIVSAASDIRLCEDLFEEWSTHLDKCVQLLSSSRFIPRPYCHGTH